MPRRVVPIESALDDASPTRRPARVVRHDQVRAAGQAQPGEDDAARLEGVELGDEHGGVDDGPCADHAQRARVQDARGNQVQLVGLRAGHDGVPGVVAALVPGDQIAFSASRSTTLPLPSSPHWAPTITVAGIG